MEDPVSFGASERAIPYIQSTRKPVADMETFIRENQDKLDCLDIVVKNEEKKRDLWKNSSGKCKRCVYHFFGPSAFGDFSQRFGKDAGIRFLLEYLGLNREGLAAFGDGDNDKDSLLMPG